MTFHSRTGIPDAQKQLASLPVAVLLLAPDLQIVSANPIAEQFFGQSSRRLEGRGLGDVVALGESGLEERLHDNEAPFSARETQIIVTGLGPRQVDLATAPVADAPGWQLLTIHDSGAFEALGDDSGGADLSVVRGPEILAHEIRNPLAGIRGAAQLLARKFEAADRSLTDLIVAEVDRIAGLIERMQLLSGKTAPVLEPCNLHELIRRAIAVLQAGSTQGEGWIDIAEEFDPSLPPVLGDPDGLVQVLINLLANAREACAGQDSAMIAVRTRFASGLQFRSAQTGKSVRLSVEIRITDNGPGVPVTMRDHLFAPFVTTRKGSHGLGLALVRKLVRDMNGRISHERDDAAALTHFRIHLPLAHDADPQPRHDEALP